jgi:hypothetical protein
MGRHLLRGAAGFFVLVVCLTLLSGPAKAQAAGSGVGQLGILDDPFTFYYAFYLPNQQLQSLRSTPMDSINTAMVQRQYFAQNDRQNLYNPISPYSDQNYDPMRPYSRQQGRERVARAYRYSHSPSNQGTGPSLYYGRAAQYFPGLRQGRGQNANVYTKGGASRPRGSGGGMGGGGGGGMGGMGGGGMGGMGGMM